MENIQVGTYGWNGESWSGEFYPDDLPEDWLLDYYSNAYRAVLVPESTWNSWSEENLEDVLEAVEGDFSFYFEVCDNVTDEKQGQLTRIVEVFEDRAEGIVLASEESSLEECYAGLPVTLISNTQVLPGWQWRAGEVMCSGAVCGLIDSIDEDPKKQTALLQSFKQSLPETTLGAPLIVYSPNVDMNRLVNLKTIAEFLGY